ncbi:MAG: transcriptional repressor [Deltaproteobacteria bacterium]|nr:transcriptional repressor [Deltaproteobacteria bacterium]
MDRNTRQRHAIELVFKAADRPLSVQDVLEAGQKILPALGIATVYRAIKGMVDEKWLTPVQIPGENPYYEPAGKTHHHHFRCRQCQKVFELEGCVFDFDKHLPNGFHAEHHDLVIYGRCPICPASVKSTRRAARQH